MFVGRQNELRALAGEYSAKRSSLVVLYGRRRVGKSELLLQFLKSRPGLYFVGKTAPAEFQRREFAREAARLIGDPLIEHLTDSWKELLSALEQRYPSDGKLVIVLDEFQWLAESAPELLGVLQELWDRRFAKSGKVMLILCGSYLGFMEREVLSRKGPLFGRRTLAMRLLPLEPGEAAEFHKRWSRSDQAMAYFICGGVPLYLRWFDTDLSVRQNIENNLLGEYAPLFREPDFLLREELRELDNYYAILMCTAQGTTKLADIAKFTGISPGSAHYYTEALVNLGYVEKRYPVTSLRERPPQRHLRLAIADPLLRFWFRFVFPHQSSILLHGPRKAYQLHVAPELAAFAGRAFEDFCRRCLPGLYAAEGIDSDFKIGEYFDSNVQIDIVGIRSDNVTDLGECKWGRVRSIPALRGELDAKVEGFPNRRGASITRRYFLQQRPKNFRPEPGERVHDLKDLYR